MFSVATPPPSPSLCSLYLFNLCLLWHCQLTVITLFCVLICVRAKVSLQQVEVAQSNLQTSRKSSQKIAKYSQQAVQAVIKEEEREKWRERDDNDAELKVIECR